MNIQEYITSGMLQGYCLDLLTKEAREEVERMCRIYPEIGRELKEIETGLERFALSHAETPGEELQERIWGTLENLNREQEMDMENLPEINRFTDYKQWLGLVKPFIPEALSEPKYVHVLRANEKITQLLVVAEEDVPDEVHENISESLLVLEGECECTIGDNVIRLGPGGFVEIPLHVHHDVRKLTPRVAAIVQHVAV